MEEKAMPGSTTSPSTKIFIDGAKESILTRNMNIGGSIRMNPLGLAIIVVSVLGLLYFTFSGGSTQVDPHDSTVSMKQLLSVAIEAAKRGGAEVKRIREMNNIGEKSKGETLEGANNPVTDGDMLSHKAMYYGILKAFPSLRVISEEHDTQSIDMETISPLSYSDAEVESIVTEDERISVQDIDVWIDPLDATQEYTENLLQYVTTMVCIAVKGKPVMGIIHKPFEDVTAWGWNGPKTFVSKLVSTEVSKNHPEAHRDPITSRIIVSRSHAGEVNDIAKKVFGPEATVTPAGGAGFKALEVIKGNQDIYVHTTLIKKWDICAGDAILRSLGSGKLTTLKGADVDYSGQPLHEKNEGGVIAAMHDHPAFVNLLKDVDMAGH